MNRKKFLSEFEKRLKESLQRKNSRLFSRALHQSGKYTTLGAGAKRFRPELVYAFGTAVGAAGEDLVKMAVTAELVHTASLLHDDVIDNGTHRRGKPCVHVVKSNTTAVLCGDLLYSRALVELGGFRREVMTAAIQTVTDMTIASSLEYESRGNAKLDRKSWENIAIGKTGRLFGWCGMAAALEQGNPAAARDFARCGEQLGMAFQLADDILDFYSASTGKKTFADLVNRNPNYVLCVSARLDRKLHREITGMWNGDESAPELVRELGEKIRDSGCINRAMSAFQNYLEHCLVIVEKYDLGQIRGHLRRWTEKLYRVIQPAATQEIGNKT